MTETQSRTLLRGPAYALALLVFILDQLSKYWVLNLLDLPRRVSVEVLPVLNLTMVWNRGVSMGLFQADSPFGRWLLTGVTALIALMIAAWLWRETNRMQSIALALVLGGALGNIVDRIRFGAVADFIHLHAGGWSFYVFNIADAGITVGVALLLLTSLQRAERRSPAETGPIKE